WPDHGNRCPHVVTHLVEDGDSAFAVCACERPDGVRCRNTVFFRTWADQIISVEVFFGAEAARHSDEEDLRTVVDSMAHACCRKDSSALARHFAPDVRSFDPSLPVQCSGAAAVAERAIAWLGDLAGNLEYEIQHLTVHARGQV